MQEKIIQQPKQGAIMKLHSLLFALLISSAHAQTQNVLDQLKAISLAITVQSEIKKTSILTERQQKLLNQLSKDYKPTESKKMVSMIILSPNNSIEIIQKVTFSSPLSNPPSKASFGIELSCIGRQNKYIVITEQVLSNLDDDSIQNIVTNFSNLNEAGRCLIKEISVF